MPDSGISDGSVLTSAYVDTYIREQVVATVTAATRPTGVQGRVIAETDTDQFQVYTGSAWVQHGGWGAMVSYTPTLTNVSAGAATGYYWRIGPLGFLMIIITAGTATAGGAITASMPSGWTHGVSASMSLTSLVGTTKNSAIVGSGATTVGIYKDEDGTSWTGGDSLTTVRVGLGVVWLA